MIAETLPKILAYIRAVKSDKKIQSCSSKKILVDNLHPTNMTQMVKIFSASVLGATFPKPTDVSDVKVK
jgi:hypothetical protein